MDKFMWRVTFVDGFDQVCNLKVILFFFYLKKDSPQNS